MRSSVLFATLQNLIQYKPSQNEIAKIIGVKQSVIGNRVMRDSEFKDEEVKLLETHYAVSLRGNSDPNTIQLDFYDNVAGSCGAGLMVFDESCHKISVPKDIISRYSTTNKYSVILAKGSSMQPEIMDNDKVIIKMWNGEQIIDDRIYLFRYDNEIFLKKLCKNFDQIVVKSNNPEFPHRFIEGDKIKNLNIIGEVVGLLRNF